MSRERLIELQGMLIDVLLEHFRTKGGNVKPEMLGVARRLLADNGIDARELADARRNLAELAALTLPFQ